MGEIERFNYQGDDEDGYPYGKTVYILYCDACGSFAIRGRIPVLSAALLLTGLLGSVWWWRHVSLTNLTHWTLLGQIAWWALYAILALLVLFRSFDYLGHRCTNCGNTRISVHDSLKFEERGVAGPQQAHEHGIQHGKWYEMFYMYPLIIVFVFLLPLIQVGAMLFLGIREIVQKKNSPP